MNNNVEKFLSEVFGEVRVEKDNFKLWFCAGDIAKVLNFSSTQKITDKVDDEDKDYRTWVTLGGKQNMVCINESGLYQAILSITKKDKERYEKSREFKRWITGIVIPAIRKDGAYIQDEEKVSQGELSEEEFILKAMTIMQNKIDRLSRENAEMKPKVEYVDKILSSTDAVTTTQIAKDYGLSARQLNDILKEEKIQYKQNSQWLLYSKYADKGYMKSDTFRYDKHNGEVGTKINSKWTQQGRLFIHEVLKGRNIKPIA